MSRLIDDPAKVGPQTYFPSYEQVNKIPVGTIDWQNSKESRGGVPVTGITLAEVGPGKYQASSKSQGIMNPSIPRMGRGMLPIT